MSDLAAVITRLRATRTIVHDSETYLAGDTLPAMEERQAAALLAVGAAEAVEAPADPPKDPGPDPKKKPAAKG
jgi:hypothetical protein